MLPSVAHKKNATYRSDDDPLAFAEAKAKNLAEAFVKSIRKNEELTRYSERARGRHAVVSKPSGVSFCPAWCEEDGGIVNSNLT